MPWRDLDDGNLGARYPAPDTRRQPGASPALTKTKKAREKIPETIYGQPPILQSMKYTVILDPQEEGGYAVRCLEVPGAISQGETKEEALKNIKEAIELVLEVLHEELERSQKISNVEITKVEVAEVHWTNI